MFSELFDTLLLWYGAQDKYGQKSQPGNVRALLYFLGTAIVFFTMMVHKEIMMVASPGLLAIIVVPLSLVLSIGSIVLLNRVGIIKNLLLAEFLSLVMFVGFLCALVLLAGNYRLGIIE